MGDNAGVADFQVSIVDDHMVEVRRGASRLRFSANLRDHEVYVGRCERTGPALSEAEERAALERLYEFLNVERRMKVDFVRPDGTLWGQAQGWQAKPVTEEEIARLNRGFFRRLFGR